MADAQPFIETMNASDVRRQWSSVINRVFRGETRVVVEKSGLPVAAIISAADLERFLRMDRQERQFAALRESWVVVPEEPPG